ncbi:MAG: hypothetical protein M0D54_19745 [Hyphomonadaceae bacterium JAD_PAG50586_4]|nr:MAG: hypothetical protein M0D54_19745 [Hyphomonadaceae bacterium JAD_PAG50586_4]
MKIHQRRAVAFADIRKLRDNPIMSGASYMRVRWLHDHPNEPVDLWSELDDQRFEVRKVEIWRDGRVGFAARDRESGGTLLGTVAMPSLSEIAANPEFEPEEISGVEFEACWQANVR